MYVSGKYFCSVHKLRHNSSILQCDMKSHDITISIVVIILSIRIKGCPAWLTAWLTTILWFKTLKQLVSFVHQGPEKKMKEEQDDMERKLREEEEKSKKIDSEGDEQEDEEEGEEEDEEAEEEGEDGEETDEDTGTEEDSDVKKKDEL